MKMHLAAKVPNEGARRLAWWIGTRFGGDVDAFADAALISASMTQRLLAGEIVPGTDLAEPIGFASEDFVSRLDWQRPAIAGWFAVPPARPDRKAA